MSLLFLIGMPGAGKSYWAKEIANAYRFKFVDTDLLIEAQQNKTIPAIFQEYGEAVFREMEQTVLKDIINNQTGNTVVAVGGGTPCFHNQIEDMLQAGTVLYLQTPIEILISRLQNSISQRPLLEGKEGMHTYLEALYNVRQIVYEKAHHILPAENISLTTFEKIIASCTDRQ